MKKDELKNSNALLRLLRHLREAIFVGLMCQLVALMFLFKGWDFVEEFIDGLFEEKPLG